MATGESAGPIHPVPTRRSGYRYLFYDKHHGRGGPDAARWLPSLSRDQEFGVFDVADFHDLSDDRAWFYGVGARGDDEEIPDLGTWGQQIAEFPYSRPDNPWHGYPLGPLGKLGPQNRRGEESRPPKEVLRKMEEARLITARERKRLAKGHHL